MRLAPSNPTLTIPVHQDRLFKQGGAHIKLGEPSKPRSNAITGGIYDNAGRKAALNGMGSLNQPILSPCFLVSSGVESRHAAWTEQPVELRPSPRQLPLRNSVNLQRRSNTYRWSSARPAHHFTFPAVPVLAELTEAAKACESPVSSSEAWESTRYVTATVRTKRTLAAAGTLSPSVPSQPQAHEPRVASP